MEQFGGLGRGYLLAFAGVILTAILSAIVMIADPGQTRYVMGFWKEFLTWFVLPVIGAKEIGKIGVSIANGKKKP